ncbi:MAG: hypothetical protein M1827_007565 [Pycnora praestabilis]|nr:MAG: hypothetical protein M1827_007565 [Pycnora praestabilis]
MASKITSYGQVPSGPSKLYYEQEGNKSGPAILFIHGLGGTTNAFQSIVGKLQDFNLVRFDFSGHGRSTVPSSKTSIASYVEDCEATIKHFDLSNITVVGHSLGCLIAMQLAAKQPSLVKNLVLFGPLKGLPQAGRDGCKARAKTVRENGMAAVADTVVGNALAAATYKEKPEVVGFAREMLTRQDKEGYALACEALAEGEDPEWKSIRAKTTILSGKEDKVSNPTTCKAIEDLLTEAEVKSHSWENVGHWHMLEKAPEAAKVVKEAASS